MVTKKTREDGRVMDRRETIIITIIIILSSLAQQPSAGYVLLVREDS
jgi:hypothetical protein